MKYKDSPENAFVVTAILSIIYVGGLLFLFNLIDNIK